MPNNIPMEQPDGTITWVDGDTFKKGKQNYRLPNVNAPEKGRLWDVGGGNTIYSPSQDTGETTLMGELAKTLGATKPTNTGSANQGRIVGDLINPETGASVADTAIVSGILDPNSHTPDDVLYNRRMSLAASKLVDKPSEDPILKLGREARQKKEDAGVVPYLKGNAKDEQQYAALKGMVGVKALQDATEEIQRLQTILDDDGDFIDKFTDSKLSPEARVSIQKQIDSLKRNVIFGTMHNDLVSNVVFRKNDRTLDNKSYNNTTDSLKRSTWDAISSLYSMVDAVAEPNQWEGLSGWAKQKSATWKAEADSLPETIGIMTAKKELTNGDWNWRDVSVTAQAVMNTLASSVPSMAAMLAGGAVAGPVGAFAPVWMMYSGQAYRDQPEDNKNALSAITYGAGEAILDNLGFKGLLGAKANMIFRGAERQIVIDAMKDRALKLPNPIVLTDEQAILQINNAAKSVVLEMAKGGADMARRQWRSREAVLNGLGSMSMAVGKEGTTEAAQTILEEMAQTGNAFDTSVRYNTGFWEKLEESFLGGAAAGGAIKGITGAADIAHWRVLEDYEKLDRIKQKEGSFLRSAIKAKDPDASINIRDIIKNEASAPPMKGLDQHQGLGTTLEKTKAALLSPLSWFRHLGETTIPTILDEKTNRILYFKSILKSLMTPGVLAGDHFDGARQRIISDWKTQDRDSLATMLKVPAKSIDGLLRKAYTDHWQHGTQTGNDVLDSWWASLQQTGSTVAQTIDDMGGDSLKWLSNPEQIFTEASFDSRVLAANQGYLNKWLQSKGQTPAQADQTINFLLSGDPTKIQGASQNVLKRLGAFTAPELSHIFNENVMDAYENYKHRVANGVAKETLLGSNGEKLASLLEKMEENQEFSSPAEQAFITQQVQDWFKIINSDYHSLRDTPNLEKVLSWTSTLTMMAYLGKAALSSIPELAFTMLGSGGKDIVNQLRTFGKEFGKNLGDELNRAASHNLGQLNASWFHQSTATGRINRKLFNLNKEIEDLEAQGKDATKQKTARDKLVAQEQARLLHDRLGYNDSGYNAQTRYDITGARARRQLAVFARLIGLVAQTDATRMSRLAIASDMIHTDLLHLQAIPPGDRADAFSGGKEITKRQIEAYTMLTSFGMDVPMVLEIMDKLNVKEKDAFNQIISNFSLSNDIIPEAERLKAGLTNTELREFIGNLNTTLRNFVDQRVANPQTSNLPKFMQDPRFRPLTIMTRFVATFTAEILPRLWRQYLRDGNSGMRWSAFTTMATAIMLGAMANTLKDVVGYGDDDNPYIKSNWKKTQRAVYASGLLGQAQGLVDRVLPLYDFEKKEKKDPTFGDRAKSVWNTAKGESPILSWGSNVFAGAYGIATADSSKELGKAAQTLSRATPVIGSFPWVGKEIAKKIGGQ